MPQTDASDDFSFTFLVSTLLQRFSRGRMWRASSGKKRHNRARRGRSLSTRDAEQGTALMPQRVVVPEGNHTMMYPGYHPRSMGYGDESGDYSEEMAQMMNNMAPQEAQKLQYAQMLAIRSICHATSMEEVQRILDWEVSDDWLGGLDALPGNIYLIFSLNCKFPRNFASMPRNISKRLGYFMIFLIQLLAPPFIFFQYVSGYGLDDHDQIHWDKFGIDLSDWYPDKKYYLTKIIAGLFLTCFCLNGLFCHLDERNAWLKVDKIINTLNYNGQMHDACSLWLYIGAFMNSWVIFWLCMDVFLVLGTSESVVEVILDALGLAFLYNLDDVESDLRFVDEDDWPGLPLAWLEKNIGQVATEFADIDEAEPSLLCNCFLSCCGCVLVIFVFVLPMVFMVVPWKELHPDPFFEGITQAYLDTNYMRKTARLLMNATSTFDL